MNAAEPPLLIEPVVGRPREAEAGRTYLVTVDLRGPLAPDGTDGPECAWPYREEELTFTVGLDGAPHFVCEVLDDPSVVLHRFGGTYGPARFVVTAGSLTGPAGLWLTISNQWGMPVRKAELPCRIREPGTGAEARAPVVGYVPGASGDDDGYGDAEYDDGYGDRYGGGEYGGQGYGGGPPRVAAPRLTGRTPRPADGQDPAPPHPAADRPVPVVLVGRDRSWGVWIADTLERHGVRAAPYPWDPADETPLDRCLRDLTPDRGPVLLVLSPAFFRRSPRDGAEWNAALSGLLARHPGRLRAVSVTAPGELPRAADPLAPVVLAALDSAEATRRLLALFAPETHETAEIHETAEAQEATEATEATETHEATETRETLGTQDAPDRTPERVASPAGARYPGESPAVWGGVPRRNTRFTGREPLLDAVHHALHEATGAVTLSGMSGVGKTQLAVEYAHRFAGEYDVVWWVSADKRVTCRLGLAALAPALGLSTGVEYGERLRAARDALRRGDPYSRWLLILDGADEPDQIWDLVPTGPGHVLITARNPEWGEHNSSLLEVPVYDRTESVAFVRRRAPRLTYDEAGRLAQALEDLPLLLDQTAGWLRESDLSVEDYIALLEGGIDQDVVSISADFPVAFQTGWSILLDKLRETVPESVELLRLCTFFAPGAIPVRLVRDLPPDTLPEKLRGLVDDPVRWARAINKLRQYAVVRPVGTGRSGNVDDTLSLHRMVHQVVHLGMSQREHTELIDVARRTLTTANPGGPAQTAHWPRYAEITPHLKWADVLRSTDPAMHTLVLDCLRYLYLSGEYGEGIALGRRTLESWRQLLGAAHPRIWDLSHHYANLLRAAGDYAGTEAIDRAAVDHLREERGAQDLEHLRASGGLAADLRGLARYGEAREISHWILASYRELLGPEDARTLNAQNNLAVSLQLLGRYEESLELNRRTLETRREVLGPAHPSSLYSEINHAVDLRLLGRYQEAEALQSRSLRRHRQELGPDHPQTLRAGHHLALCRYLAGPAGARPLFGQMLERCERVLGDHDPLTQMIATSCAWLERETGDPAHALVRHTQVEERYAAMLGPTHPFTVGVRGNRGVTLLALGERRSGRAEIEHAYTGMRGAVGDDHPWTLGCALNAAAARLLTEDQDGGVGLSGNTVATALRVLGRRHPLTLACQVGHAAGLRATGHHGEAARTEEEALEGLTATLGRLHPTTVRARSRARTHWDFEPQII
ncbi:FxSxx-COOH system tetratricopeptide repeat protein [Streptomyces sp. NPDC059092]|uniref:FxSxx-COOH system tetratricopeptide repeat protein n=1 Tax=Streptomyces sp. NPDC059092 TaxID=3346725 RepID=UPI003694A517